MKSKPEHNHPAHSPPQPDHPPPTSHASRLGIALNEILIEQGLYSAAELHSMIASLESVSPATHGARVVARAWVDPAFRRKLHEKPNDAIAAFGLDAGSSELRILECTPNLHHVVVCTLCSCYPRALLGAPPTWYKDRAYRARVVRDPRGVLHEFGTDLAANTELRVHDSTAELRFLVLPLRPDNTEHLDEEALAALISRDNMIGVTQVPPYAAAG